MSLHAVSGPRVKSLATLQLPHSALPILARTDAHRHRSRLLTDVTLQVLGHGGSRSDDSVESDAAVENVIRAREVLPLSVFEQNAQLLNHARQHWTDELQTVRLANCSVHLLLTQTVLAHCQRRERGAFEGGGGEQSGRHAGKLACDGRQSAGVEEEIEEGGDVRAAHEHTRLGFVVNGSEHILLSAMSNTSCTQMQFIIDL